MPEEKVTAREVTPEVLEAGLAVRNGIFSPLTPEQWARGDEKTASVAFLGEEVVGFIPLYIREIRIGLGLTVRGAFENCVGTSEAHRSKGIGATMIEAACNFLPGKADTLCLYRGGERSKGYNFYRKTNHIDLLHTREQLLPKARAESSPDARVLISEGTHEILAVQERLLELFESSFQGWGGFVHRHAAYWSQAFGSTHFMGRQRRFFFLRLQEEGRLTAYAIAAVEPRDSALRVLDYGAVGGDADRLAVVLRAAGALVFQVEKEGLAMEGADHHPFIEMLPALGFVAKPRSRNLMALSYDSAALWAKLWRPRLHLPGVNLSVWTPRQEFTLQADPSPDARRVVLEMKEETLTRWLLGRLDLRARVGEGTVTLLNGNAGILDALAKAVPLNNWTYFHLDFC